jgi:hypothetical protein
MEYGVGLESPVKSGRISRKACPFGSCKIGRVLVELLRIDQKFFSTSAI